MTPRKKQKVSSWIAANFTTDSKPGINTVKRWIINNEIDGVVIGGLYYVYEDQTAPGLTTDAQSLADRFFLQKVS